MARTEVSLIMKYLIFGFNVIVWLLGGALIAGGTWAIHEKNAMGNIKSLTNITFDPAMIIVVVGIILFTIAFFGCVGALRENTVLLILYAVLVLIIFLTELALVIAIFLYSEELENSVKGKLKKYIERYRDDPDMQDIIDWVQMDWLGCCGIDSNKDWEHNIYFNCSSAALESCGVPYSCCKDPYSSVEEKGKKLVNLQCGYGALEETTGLNFEYKKGCFPTFKSWVKDNMIPIAGVGIFIAVLQILAICFACTMKSDINAQKAKWISSRSRRV
ncbi:DgyrCDS10087 [Dimorphilus gyrociliatus]|uniref:Tetraspanin n=1 Tax=Dimorphilus gyrociliatus TaxID=2664684 RepID=A0A7I8VZD6_9ANNE|nr:DgyrCDS10087 [Dimorphilus gyrociliatus]